VVAIAVLLLGVVPAPAYAWWHGPHVWVGGPFWYSYPYYAPPVVVQLSAPVVVQPSTRTYVQPSAESSWYYCESSKGYYPYIKECPGGWTRVAPTPNPGS
jgi:hypothetical protein